MTTFATEDILSTTTGRLLGDIGGVYKVVSYLVGRSVYTLELLTYGERAAAAIKAAVPSVPVKADASHVTPENFQQFRSDWMAKLGPTIDLPDSLRECLADDRDPISTAEELVGKDRVIVLDIDKRT